MRYYAWFAQIVGTVALVLIPAGWPENIGRAKAYPFLFFFRDDNGLHANLPMLGILLGAMFLIAGQIALMSSEMSRGLKGIVSDREFLEAYSATVTASLETVYVAHALSPEQLEYAQSKILKGIALIVHHYYDKADSLEINACYMLAYPTADLPPGIGTIRFKEKTRPIGSYAYVLDLVLWGDPHDDLPQELAIPVENVGDPDLRLKLLPGAPATFALERTMVVQDTTDLKGYFQTEGRNVDRIVQEEQLDFFEKQGFRSFASFLLENQGKKIGVLNVQSNRARIFGRKNRHQKLVTELLEPLIKALSLLIRTSRQGDFSI
jgi:hypothetical protein